MDTNTTPNATNPTDKNAGFDNIDKELQTRFALLPKEIQETIMSSDYQMKLFEIAKKNKLTYEKLATIEMETTLVLLGMTQPESFPQTLTEELKLDTTTANAVVADINTQIMTPMRDALKKIYPSDSEDEDTAEVQTPVARVTSDKGAGITDILKKSGIELNPTEPVKETPTITIGESREDLLKSIENPVKTTTKPLSAEIQNAFDLTRTKMTNTVSTTPKTTDYSLKPLNTNGTPATSNTTVEPQKVELPSASPLKPKDSADPYREVI